VQKDLQDGSLLAAAAAAAHWSKAVAALPVAAAQQQQADGLAGANLSPAVTAAAPWLGHFSAMPYVQARFAQMLSSHQIKPSEIYESAITAALQLNEQTLLSALDQLSASLQQQEAKAMAAGKAVKRGDGEVNGKLVSLCRKLVVLHPANVDAAAGAAGHATAGMGYGFGAFGFGNWNSYLAAAAVAGGADGRANATAGAALPKAAGKEAAADAVNSIGMAGTVGLMAPVPCMMVNGIMMPFAAAARGVGYGMRGMTGGAVARGVGTGTQLHAAGVAGKPLQGKERRGRQVAGMTDYWQALCSGLDAGADAYSDVEEGDDDGDAQQKGRGQGDSSAAAGSKHGSSGDGAAAAANC
jgi:hypothetical protein